MRKTISVVVVALALAACNKEETVNPDEGSAVDDDFAAGAPEDGDESVADADDEPEAAVLTQTSFEEGINEHMQDVADCYADAQSKNAKLGGTMQARFTIAADGKVERVEAVEGSSLDDDGMTKCIEDKAKGWEFDPTPSGESMPMEFPFTLAPG